MKIARDGQELGAWPFDVVFALIRCNSLVPTDTFWIEGMDEWRTLSEAIPPSPSHTRPATFLGRDDEDMPWAFYCRGDTTVIGPRPFYEVLLSICFGNLTEENLVFVMGEERWISVGECLRKVEKETPGILNLFHNVQAAVASFEGSEDVAQRTPEPEADKSDWIQTGLRITAVSPHLGGAYLGYQAVKRMASWLNQPQSEPQVKKLRQQLVDPKGDFFSKADHLLKNRRWADLTMHLQGSPYPLSAFWKERYDEANRNI